MKRRSNLDAISATLPMGSNARLVIPTIVVGPVVIHHHQYGYLAPSRHPQGAHVVHQVAVRLKVHHHPTGSFVGQSNSQTDAYLGGRTQMLSGMPVGLVKVPKAARPVLDGIRSEHPIMSLDGAANLQDHAGRRHGYRRSPCLRLLSPRRALLPVLSGESSHARFPTN